MSAHTQSRAKAAPAAKASGARAGLLQRQCACGGSAGLTGECADCDKKKLVGSQPKLTGGAAGDPSEREADRAAERVLSASAPAVVQEALNSPGWPLDAGTRSFMEARFGHDFGRVRVHTDERAARAARSLRAAAFTAGPDVVFARDAYRPWTGLGRQLLTHELTHVVQHGAGRAGAGARLSGSHDDPAERQADGVALRLAAGLPAALSSPVAPSSLLSLAPEDWFRGEIEGGKAAADTSTGRGVVHDLGHGQYYTDRADVAEAYAEMRSPDDPAVRRVLAGKVDPQALGRVLDLTKEPDFMLFFNMARRGIPKISGEPYRNILNHFLSRKGLKLEDFDIIIGPEAVRDGRQMCVRTPEVLEKVRAAMTPQKPPDPTSGAATPPATPPPTPPPVSQAMAVGAASLGAPPPAVNAALAQVANTPPLAVAGSIVVATPQGPRIETRQTTNQIKAAQAAAELVRKYGGRLDPGGNGLTEIFNRSAHLANPTLERAAANELGVIIRYLEHGSPDGRVVLKLTVIPSVKGRTTPDFFVEYTDGSSERLEVTTVTSAPAGRVTHRVTIFPGNKRSAGNLVAKTKERAADLTALKEAIRRKAIGSGLQLNAPLPNMPAGGTIEVGIPFGISDPKLIDKAIEDLEKNVHANVRGINVTYTEQDASGHAVRRYRFYLRQGNKFVLVPQSAKAAAKAPAPPAQAASGAPPAQAAAQPSQAPAPPEQAASNAPGFQITLPPVVAPPLAAGQAAAPPAAAVTPPAAAPPQQALVPQQAVVEPPAVAPPAAAASAAEAVTPNVAPNASAAEPPATGLRVDTSQIPAEPPPAAPPQPATGKRFRLDGDKLTIEEMPLEREPPPQRRLRVDIGDDAARRAAEAEAEAEKELAAIAEAQALERGKRAAPRLNASAGAAQEAPGAGAGAPARTRVRIAAGAGTPEPAGAGAVSKAPQVKAPVGNAPVEPPVAAAAKPNVRVKPSGVRVNPTEGTKPPAPTAAPEPPVAGLKGSSAPKAPGGAGGVKPRLTPGRVALGITKTFGPMVLDMLNRYQMAKAETEKALKSIDKKMESRGVKSSISGMIEEKRIEIARRQYRNVQLYAVVSMDVYFSNDVMNELKLLRVELSEKSDNFVMSTVMSHDTIFGVENKTWWVHVSVPIEPVEVSASEEAAILLEIAEEAGSAPMTPDEESLAEMNRERNERLAALPLVKQAEEKAKWEEIRSPHVLEDTKKLEAQQRDVADYLVTLEKERQATAAAKAQPPAAKKAPPPAAAAKPQQPAAAKAQPPALGPAPAPAQQAPLLPGMSAGPTQQDEAMEVVGKLTHWANGLISSGTKLANRLGTSDSPTDAQKQAFLKQEDSWRVTMKFWLNYFTQRKLTAPMDPLRALEDRVGGKLKEIRTLLGG